MAYVNKALHGRGARVGRQEPHAGCSRTLADAPVPPAAYGSNPVRGTVGAPNVP